MSDIVNSHISLMLSIYKRSNVAGKETIIIILQDLTGLEIRISMKASKTENQFETGFQQLKTGWQKRRY